MRKLKDIEADLAKLSVLPHAERTARILQLMLEAQPIVPHRKWGAWCDKHVPCSVRQRALIMAKHNGKPSKRSDNKTSCQKAETSATETISKLPANYEPLHEEWPEDWDGGLHDRWLHSVGAYAGEAIAMQAFWDRQFPGWRQLAPSSSLVTLATQAAESWATVAKHLSK